MEVGFEAGSVLCEITLYLAPIFRGGGGGGNNFDRVSCATSEKSMKEVIVSCRFSKGSVRARDLHAVKPASR